MTKNEFIKIGEQIIAKPKGADYDLIPGKVYDLSWNRWEDSPIFKENGELNLPKKVYSTKTDDIFKKRIITYFNKANTNTTGVMLAGTKGTGNSVNSTIYLERKYELYKQYCRSYKKLYELLESKIGEGCDANTEQTIDISQGSIAA